MVDWTLGFVSRGGAEMFILVCAEIPEPNIFPGRGEVTGEGC